MSKESAENIEFVQADTGLENLGKFEDVPTAELVGRHVKIRISDGERTERFWIMVLGEGPNPGELRGRIDNDPFLVTNVKHGQKITFHKREIFDFYDGSQSN